MKIQPICIIFDAPPGPSHLSGRFIEVETPDGKGIRVGEWEKREDGQWSLNLFAALPGHEPSQLADGTNT